MKRLTYRTEKGLFAFLTDNGIKCELLQDGWMIAIYYHDETDLFRIGKMWGSHLAANPQTFTIQELEQRGDIPGLF
jgi:phage antirepressor YoqD-like protein